MADAYLRHIAKTCNACAPRLMFYTLGDATLAFCGYFGSVLLVVVLLLLLRGVVVILLLHSSVVYLLSLIETK